MNGTAHIVHPHTRRFAALAAACWLAAATGCDDDDAGSQSSPFRTRDGGADGARPEPPPDLDPCQNAGEDGGTADCTGGRHCVDGRCMYNTCGDGVKAASEQCDDGNELIGDGCDPACKIKPGPRCGDAVVDRDQGEECDDGNVYDDDACTNACMKNACGNGRVDGREECDDGDLVNDNECSNQCTENRCRNGRLDVGEECDDGNRIHDDGCTNACRIVLCGNGNREGDEECDDGNATDDDACANACTANVCGNQRVDPGELCDGDTVEYACSDDCSSTEQDDCRPCEEEHCRTYQGADWVAGCFMGQIPPELVPEVDAMFAQQCIDAVNCARRTGCGFDAATPVVDCYCGSRSVDECNVDGPADDAPCRDEWFAATRAANNLEAMQALADLTVPSGWVYYLMECDRTQCAAECVPQ